MWVPFLPQITLVFFSSFVFAEFQIKHTTVFHTIRRNEESHLVNNSSIADVVPRIVNGAEATETQGQHQVSLRLSALDESFYGSGFYCGGSLISEKMVLTAAHCTFYGKIPLCPSQVRAVVGGLSRAGISSTTLIRKISKIKVHQNYNPNNLYNDIAILNFASPLKLPLTGIVPINVASTIMPEGTTCQVTGWGVTEYGSISGATDLLMVASLEILSLDYCNSSKSYGGSEYPLLTGMLCAGVEDGGTGSCQGDSGGPLVCENQLVGIVSWGFGCAEKEYPDVYTNVYFYRDWIAANSSLCLRVMQNSLFVIGFSVFVITRFCI